jgi:isopenicillin-N N-acyltransferase-like protein
MNQFAGSSRPHSSWTVVLLALSSWTVATHAEDALRAVAPFTEATIIEGTARERGEAYGRTFSEAIREFYASEIQQPFVGHPASQQELLDYAAQCAEIIREECPMIAEELNGIASGSGLSLHEIVLINLHEELYHRGPLPKYGHCTAVALAPSETGGPTLVGQTWDWMQSVAGKSSVLEWRREEGASVLAYGFPGMPFGAGMNEHGIALCWTSAALETQGASPRVGLPSYVLIAHLLAQPDLDSVIRVASRDRHAGWFTFVMADGQGNLVNIEGSPHGVAIERSTTSVVRVGYGISQMQGRFSTGAPTRHPRCEKMCRLLEGSHGRTNQNMLQDYFSDPMCEISVAKSTIDMMIFNTTARTAILSRGPDYGTAWREFRFALQPKAD